MTDTVPRQPGWKLISGTGGPQGWHLVASTTPERSVMTKCGITGRVITEDQRMIVLCSTCAEPPSP